MSWSTKMAFNDLTTILYRVFKSNESWYNFRGFMQWIILCNLSFFRILYDQFSKFDPDFRSFAISQHRTDFLMLGMYHFLMILEKISAYVGFMIVIVFFLVHLIVWQLENFSLKRLQFFWFRVLFDVNVGLTLG